jgi:hypothetical protein
VEERRFKRRVTGRHGWASAPVAPLSLKAVVDSVENAALKGRSSTVQEVSVEGPAVYLGSMLCLERFQTDHYPVPWAATAATAQFGYNH